MANIVANIVKFKQEVNESLDRCIEIIKEQDTSNIKENNEVIRLVTAVMNYYDRMKKIYSSTQSDGDDDQDSDKLISDGSDDEYTKIMEDRVYYNHNFHADTNNIQQQEMEIRRTLFGINHDGFNEFDRGDDNSVDPVNYSNDDDTKTNNIFDFIPPRPPRLFDSNDEKKTEKEHTKFVDDTEGDFILHNTKKTLKDYVENVDIEINSENIDYEDIN